jgi:hypothetical protein
MTNGRLCFIFTQPRYKYILTKILHYSRIVWNSVPLVLLKHCQIKIDWVRSVSGTPWKIGSGFRINHAGSATWYFWPIIFQQCFWIHLNFLIRNPWPKWVRSDSGTPQIKIYFQPVKLSDRYFDKQAHKGNVSALNLDVQGLEHGYIFFFFFFFNCLFI